MTGGTSSGRGEAVNFFWDILINQPQNLQHLRMKLLSISESDKPDKKLKAVFLQDNGRTKTTHFGAKGMDDYTLTHDKEQRGRYRTRHAKDLETGDPTRAGFLSMEILWGASVSRARNISSYKKKHNL